MAYFDCIVGGSGKGNTLVVTCADDLAGASITCTNGTKTYTKTCPSTAPYEVTFYGLAAGTWTVSATVSGNTYTTTVVITDYEAELGGFNWKVWVDLSENYTSSDFTDLDDLLSDETAIRELMTIHACVDYLAEIAAESADVETIIGNDLCAKWINNRDYALDTLYANEIIADYMDTADKYFYGEWVITDNTTTPPTWGAKGNVPVMTANTAPYGEAFGSTKGSGYDYYAAFNGNSADYWYSEGATNQSVGYKFTTPQRINRVRIVALYSSVARLKNFKIQARNTGGSWVDIYTGQYPNTQDYVLDVSINPSSAYDEYQLYCVDTHSSANYIAIKELQFYGRELSVSVPKMDTNTTPYGEASGSASTDTYKAFDNDSSTRAPMSMNLGNNLCYTFVRKIVPKMAYISTPGSADNTARFKIQGTNGNDAWSDLSSNLLYIGGSQVAVLDNANNTEYEKMRIYVSATSTAWSDMPFTDINFYGLDYSEREFEAGTTKKWLYDHGVELEALTGQHGSSGNEPEFESDSIIMEAGSSGSGSYSKIRVTNAIDFTPFNTLRAKSRAFIANNKSAIGIENAGGTGIAVMYVSSSDMPYNIGLDISSINASQYAYAESVSGANGKFEVVELWLE